MVSWNNLEQGLDGTGNAFVEGTCLSTDTKPTDVANGSRLLEIDTSTLYLYDAANRVWRAWS